MKKFFYLLSFMLTVIVYLSYSQAKTGETQKDETTKVGEFLSRRGSLNIKDVYKIGTYTDQYGKVANFEAIVIYNPANSDIKVKGIKVEITKEGKYGEESKSCFLDLDEIETVIQSINYMIETAKTFATTPREYSEITFSSKDNFKLGFFQKELNQSSFVEVGNYSSLIMFLFSIEDFNKIKNILEKGNALLLTK